MAKRYKYESFTCINYDDMMETYNQMYAEDYQLISLSAIDYLNLLNCIKKQF